MSDRKIKPVLDNMDKRNTYKVMMGRYKIAVKHNFYFEALLISYSALEDRLISFLYHIGAINDRQNLTLNKRAGRYLKGWCAVYSKKDCDRKSLKNISNKLDLIEGLLLWIKDGCSGEKDHYLDALSSVCLKKFKDDLDEFLGIINGIREWCEYRNEVIHALMNKNTACLDSELANRVEQGMGYVRFIDGKVEKLKRGRSLRKANNLKMG